MNRIIILIFIIVTTYSCCEETTIEVGINIIYPNITESHNVAAIQNKANSEFERIDTLYLAEINESNDFTLFLELDTLYDYIFFVDQTNYTDTLTDIFYLLNEDRCEPSIEEFRYKLNGELLSNEQIVITHEDNNSLFSELFGTWYSSNNDTLLINTNYLGSLRFYSGDSAVYECKIDGNIISFLINDVWHSSICKYDKDRDIFIIYEYLQTDSTYFSKRPEWLNKEIISMIENDLLEGGIGSHAVYRFRLDNIFIYLLYYEFARYPLTFYMYNEDGSKVDWNTVSYDNLRDNGEKITIWNNMGYEPTLW